MAKEHDSDAPGPPGASDPGEPGYEGEVQVGDEASGGALEAYDVPFGRPGQTPDGSDDIPAEIRAKLDEVDRQLDEAEGNRGG